MRPYRTHALHLPTALLAGLLTALLLVVSMSLGLTSVAADAAGKPSHTLKHLKGVEVGNTNHFFLEGKVVTFPKGTIKVLRNVAGGKYAVYKKTKTSKKGAFRVAITQAGSKRTCYKIQVPKTDVYKATTSPVIGCIESGN